MIYVPCDFSGERQKDTLFPYGKYPLPKVMPGYWIDWEATDWMAGPKWAWAMGKGWRTTLVKCREVEIHYGGRTPQLEVAPGESLSFYTPEEETLFWSVYPETEGVSISQDGVLTVAPEKTEASFTVFAHTARQYGMGAVGITVR